MTSGTKITPMSFVSVLPGVSYLPDKIEIEIDHEIVARVELEFLDFLKTLTDIMKLMHALKTKHLRSLQPIPQAVLREIMVGDNTGPRYKAWDKCCSGAQPGITNSAENIFRSGYSSVTIPAGRQKPVYRKEQKKRKAGLDNDLIEITGKKTKPLWHVVALENQPLPVGTIPSGRGRKQANENFSLSSLLNKRNRPIHRSRSQQLLVNIKALSASRAKPSTAAFETQMDMLLAKDAGFKSVADHKAFLDTQRPHWYKDLLMEAYKMGILYSIEIVRAFEALGRYYETTSTSINLAKPKLCYLLMSLPVWDVCQAAMQRAVDYFLHTVLEIHQECNVQAEWLRNRKLPYIVYEPLTAEMAYLASSQASKQPKSQQSLNV